jgi:hypothetical protein
MKNKILLSYKKQNNSDFAITVSHVVTRLDNKELFPEPPEALAFLKNELPLFQTAHAEARDRDMIKVATRNNKRMVMETALIELVRYATRVCNGDRTMLLSTGFDISGSKKHNGLKQIEKFEVTIDVPNEAVTKVKRVRGTRAYIHQYTTEPLTSNSIWTSKVHAANTHTFTGLQSKERYLFQVIAVGNIGEEVHSPIVAKVIQ